MRKCRFYVATVIGIFVFALAPVSSARPGNTMAVVTLSGPVGHAISTALTPSAGPVVVAAG